MKCIQILMILSITLRIQGKEESCITQDDFDYKPNCDIYELSISELEDICERIGLNMETYMFDNDDDEYEAEEEETNEKSKYIRAAKECLSIAEELDGLFEVLEEDDEETEDNPILISQLVTNILLENPELIHDLEQELRTDDPQLFQTMFDELGEGQTLLDRPDILSEIVTIMMDEAPDLLQKIDGEISNEL